MECIVGIDVSKASLDVCVAGTITRYGNSLQGIEKLMKAVGDVTLVVLEATGCYERLLVQMLCQSDIAVSVVNPKWVKDFARSQGKRAKTDPLDAAMLASYGQHYHATLRRYNASEDQLKLKELVSLRSDMVQSSVQYKNRIQQVSQATQPRLQQLLDTLEEQIKALTQEIQDLLKATEKSKVLQKAIGVGPIGAATLLAELPELGQASGKQVTSLAGLAPFDHQSGKFRGKQFCQGGRQALRNALYMAANCARRFDPDLKQFFERLRAKGKPFKLAVTACARKLLVRLNAQMRDFLKHQITPPQPIS